MLTFVAILCTAAPASAEWYAWKDDGGTLHVTNQLATAPPVPGDVVAILPFGQTRDGLGSGNAAAPGAASAVDPNAAELRRCKTRLAARLAHWRLLRPLAPKTTEQLRLENQLKDEIRAEKATLRALREEMGSRP